MDQLQTLASWIKESDNIVFSEGRVRLQRVEFLISAPQLDYIKLSTIHLIHLK